MPGATLAKIDGIPALRIEAGGYTAAICPDMGANCFLLEREGASFLRRPLSLEELRARPNLYGLPLLFPPNRIRGGAFEFQGRQYRLPINEAERGNHIHGFLSSAPFAFEGSDADSSSCAATFSFEATREAPYSTFPHAFMARLRYSVDEKGLGQRLEMENRGDTDMPLGLGFHTAFACPFLLGTSAEDYRLRLSVSEEILLERARMIPSGARVTESYLLSALNGEGITPGGNALSHHFLGTDGGRGEAILFHASSGRAIAYRVDALFAFWMLWNQGGTGGFVCVEPQTWMIDAPNSGLAAERSGFRALAPGESIALESTLGETTIA